MTEFGHVTNVHINESEDNIRVDVSLSPTREEEDIIFQSPMAGMWVAPEVGDVVQVVDVGNGRRVAQIPLNTPSFPMPSGLSEGDMSMKFNDSTFLTFRKQTDGSYNVELECDNIMDIVANQIYIGKSGNRKKVATEDHTHEYVGGGDGASTMTTDKPSDVTSTEIQ